MESTAVPKIWPSLQRLRGGLVVSCQASPGEPLFDPGHIAALALSVINGGASGLRLEGIEHVKAVRPLTRLPIIGLTKSSKVPASERLKSVYITATFEEASQLAEAGADIIAFDATPRPRPDGLSVGDLINRIHDELKLPAWADISTVDEGVCVTMLGADAISTTLAGYTEETASTSKGGPDFGLLGRLVQQVNLPIILEGRVWYPEEVLQAMKLGAYAVVVGSAITRPHLITKRFVRALSCEQQTTD